MAGGLRLAPKALEFGDVVTNSYSDLLVMATNTNSVLPLRFKVGAGLWQGQCRRRGGTGTGGRWAGLDAKLWWRARVRAMVRGLNCQVT